MKHLTRLMSILLVMAIVLGAPALTAFAQDDNPLCAGLEAADCAILNNVAVAMADVSSFRISSWSVTLVGSDGTENIDFAANGSGEVMLPADPNAPTEGLLLHLVIDSATATTPDGGTQSGSAELLILNDMIYVNQGGEWYGEQMTQEDIEDLTSSFGVDGGAVSMDLGALGIDATGVISTMRGEDGEVMGQAVQSYVTTVDINTLLLAVFNSPAFGALVGMGMDEGAGETGMDEMTPEDMQMLAAIFGPTLAGTTISFEQRVGVDDGLIHGIALDAVLNLNMTMFDPEAGTITGELHFMSELSEHNGTFTVEPPADYAPLEELEETEGLLSELGM